MLLEDLITGAAYTFKVRSLNFNGAGQFSEEATFFSCLPPQGISPPQYVISTESTLTVSWSEPKDLNGCPLQEFVIQIFKNGEEVSQSSNAPHINKLTITNLVESGVVYELTVEAKTAGGSVVSGSNSMQMANVPARPEPVLNDATVTNDSQIKVTFGVVSSDGGSAIIDIQLFMATGDESDFVKLTQAKNMETTRLITGL